MGKDIKRVLALGFFDGVHLGHAALIRKTSELAAEYGAAPAVLSFDVHPDSLVRSEQVPLINNAAARADIIRRLYGIDSVIFVHFDEAVMKTPWRDFLELIVSELSACHLVVGHDFRFGYRGEGDAERLAEYCGENGIGYSVIPKVAKDGVTVSSTYIRKLIADGEIERANAFLGHPHTLVDTVRYGYRLGRKIGAPTINMRFPEGVLIPAHGVYASKVVLEDGEHVAVTNVGVRPTVGGGSGVSVESYILDFDGNLYGRQVRVDFYGFIRPEMKFDGVDALKERIKIDAELAREFFLIIYKISPKAIPN